MDRLLQHGTSAASKLGVDILNDPAEKVIDFNRVKTMIYLAMALITMGPICLLIFIELVTSEIGHLNLREIIFGVAFLVFTVFAIARGCIVLFDERPGLVLNSEGIRGITIDHPDKFIPWSEI